MTSIIDKIKDNYLTINNCKILTIVDSDDYVWFMARSVAKLIEYVNPERAIRLNINQTNKNQFKDIKLKDSDKKINYKNIRPHTIFINEKGLKYFISNSKRVKSVEVAKYFNINICEFKTLSKESDTLSKIMKVFNGEKMICQHSISGYKIDLYFSEYNLAIECDEQNHKDRNSECEKNRQDIITKELNCTWYRFNPDDKKFDILDAIHDIYLIIKIKK